MQQLSPISLFAILISTALISCDINFGDEQRTLTIMYDSYSEIDSIQLRDLTDEFCSKHNCKCELERIESNLKPDRLIDRLTKNDWDFILFSSDIADYIENGLLQNINTAVAANRFYYAALTKYRNGDSIYALPYMINPTLLFYNKALLSKAGSKSIKDKSVEEAASLAELIYIPDSIYGFACITDDKLLTIALNRISGEYYSKPHTEANVLESVLNARLSSEQYYCRSGLRETKLFVWNLFLSGKLMFCLGDAELINRINTTQSFDKYSFDRIKTSNNPEGISFSINHYLGINRSTKNDSLAAELLMHLTSKESYEILLSEALEIGFPSDSLINSRKLPNDISKRIANILSRSKPILTQIIKLSKATY